jgi:uncharacterized protein (DUF58 family)
MSATHAARLRSRYLKPAVLAVLIAVAYVAAITRTQALPWAIASVLLATLITGVTWPHWLVRHLSVSRTGPAKAQEGETIHLLVEVRNHGRLPRFMVEAVDRLPFVGAAGGEKTLGLIAHIGGGRTRRFKAPLQCEKRGLYRLGPVDLTSSFPLGLAEARQRKSGGMQTLTVYPEVFPIVALPLAGTPSEIHRGGFLLPEGAGAAEFSGLREYRRGDNPRHIHWLTSARTNELMVKEFEPLASASLYLVLDHADDANVGSGRDSTFEYAVRIAASIARYASQSGIPIRMRGEGSRRLAIGIGHGEAHYHDILDALAVADADGATPYAHVLLDIAADCRRGENVVVFLAEPRSRAEATLQAIALLRARGAHVLALAFDRGTFKDRNASSRPLEERGWAGLVDLGVPCIPVRRGDNLVRLFNA